MRLLFYTATLVMLTLAGVFAFYALRSDNGGVGTKVVLSIDSGPMTGADDGARDKVATAPASVADAPQDPENASGGETRPAAPSEGKQFDIKVSEAPAAPADAPPAQPERQQDSAPAAVDRVAAAAADPQREDLPALPGTATDGFGSGDTPPANASAQDAPASAGQDRVVVSAAEAPAEPSRPASAPRNTEVLRDTLIPGRDRADAAAQPAPALSPDSQRSAAAAPSSGDATNEQDPKAHLDSMLAALNQQGESAPPPSAAPPAVPSLEPSAPPPPVPLKRPAGVRPSTRTAALGWAGTQVTTTETAPKSVRIAILLRGVGRDDNTSSDAVTKLPSAVSLAFMPYNGGAQQWASKARELGHEVIVQLPLEPSDYPVNNPGPETLLSSSSPDENLSRMKSVLGRFDGYTGVTNFLGGKILQSKTALRPILENLKSQGLIYVGEGNGSHAIVKSLAAELGLRYGNADVIIDAQPAPAAIKKSLERLVALARKDGTAIGLGYASRPTMEQLRAWSDTLAAEGITLVPVGALAQTPGAS